MNLQDIGARTMAILSHPVWQSIGVFVAIAIALAPTFRGFITQFSITTFKRVFWSTAIPLLAAFAIVAAVWRQTELIVAFIVLLVTVYWLKERKFEGQRPLDTHSLGEKPTEAVKPAESIVRYAKPRKH